MWTNEDQTTLKREASPVQLDRIIDNFTQRDRNSQSLLAWSGLTIAILLSSNGVEFRDNKLKECFYFVAAARQSVGGCGIITFQITAQNMDWLVNLAQTSQIMNLLLWILSSRQNKCTWKKGTEEQWPDLMISVKLWLSLMVRCSFFGEFESAKCILIASLSHSSFVYRIEISISLIRSGV